EPQSSGTAAKAEASAARVEAQIKEIVELASPGFGDRFIALFKKGWSSREDAAQYVWRRNLIIAWLADFAAASRERHMEKARQQKLDPKYHRDRQMVDKYLRMKPSWGDSDTKLKAFIGDCHGLKPSAAVEAINRGLQDQGLSPQSPERRDGEQRRRAAPSKS